MTIQPAELSKLANLLGMLGSAHDGEVVNAARKADELVRGHDATWCDIIGAWDADKDTTQCIPHHAIALELLATAGLLSDFERKFLRGIMGFQKLTTKQREILESIRAKAKTGKGG